MGVEVVPEEPEMPAAAEEVEVVLEGPVEGRVPVGRAVDQGLPGVRAVGQDRGLPGDQGNRRETAANQKTNAEAQQIQPNLLQRESGIAFL